MHKFVSVILAISVVFFPVIISGEDNTAENTENNETSTQHEASEIEPCEKAIADAKADVSSWQWIGVGCLFTLFGVTAAYIIKPTVPADRLIGKSPEYVESYTDCFIKQSRKTRAGNAWIGLGAAGAAGLVVGIIAVVAMASAAESCTESCTESVTQSCVESACSYGW